VLHAWSVHSSISQMPAIALHSVGAALREDHGLVDQTREHVQRVGVGVVFSCADPLGCVQRPPAGEHGQSAEQPALVVSQQIVAPADRGGERLLTRDGTEGPSGRDVGFSSLIPLAEGRVSAG
jgi:hypothetical protein